MGAELQKDNACGHANAAVILNEQSREEPACNQQGDRCTAMAKMSVLMIWLISVLPTDSRQCFVGDHDCHTLFTHHAGPI